MLNWPWLDPKTPDMTFSPDAIFFDLDGTLIDSAPDLTRAIDQMLDELGFPAAGMDKVSTWVGNGAQKLIERALRDAGLKPGEIESIYSQARAFFDRFYSSCCDQAAGLYPGAEELLRFCNDQSIPLALITNKPEQFTYQILDSLSLKDCFNVIIGGDSLSEKKPSALPLQYASDALKVSIESCWMIGDSNSDISAAKTAGCYSVGVSYGYNHGRPISDENPDWLCDSLKQLQQRLVNLYSQPSDLRAN